MEIRSQIKALNYFKKFLSGETEHILPFTPLIQKTASPEYNGKRLPRSTPEEEGVHCSLILKCLKALASSSDAGTHSMLFARHGKVISEVNFAPFTTKKWHVTHSMCKSVTGTAIGMLCEENLLKLSERLCEIFPEKCNLLTSKRTKSITVEHLLTMQSGVQFKELGAVTDKDWVRAYMESDVAFEPGAQFDYNSMNSYMLSAIITKKTGLSLTEYLKPRLFEPLGFGPILWEACPLGITKGGWGMYVFLEDIAKLGQLYLQNGIWNDKALLSHEWAAKATSALTTHTPNEQYGYHIWVDSASESYMFNGMFGQYVIIFPSESLIIAINSGNGHLFTQSYAYKTICETFKGHLFTSALPNNLTDRQELSIFLSKLTFGRGVPVVSLTPPWYKRIFSKKTAPIFALPEKAVKISNTSYSFNKNNIGLLPIILQCTCDSYARGLVKISFKIEDDNLTLNWHEGSQIIKLTLSFNNSVFSRIELNGLVWDIGTLSEFKKDEDDNDVLKISVCFLESSSTRLIKLVFTKTGAIAKFDESPAVALALETLQQDQAINTDPMFFKDFEFFEYKINKICSPNIRGVISKV